MKKILIFLFHLNSLFVFAGVDIIPQPERVTVKEGQTFLGGKYILSGSFEDSQWVKAAVESVWHSGAQSSDRAPLKIRIDKGGPDKPESYKLDVSAEGIHVLAATPSGCFYALQTLRHLALFSKDGTIPCITIEDSPRFSWRGFMLDESRHFFGKQKVKELLDLMAFYKLNRFHWHLTDTPGWRIEIRKYPKLTSVGAVGNHTDPGAPAAFYTQEDIKEIVDYARERFIEVIPEIDMPGHAAAAARAYPEISGGGSEKHPDFTFNPGSEKTYEFLTDVLQEIATLFPSEWIHYGGDEVHFANKQWLEIPEVKDLMKRENLQDLTGVEFYFNRRMAKVIDGLGRRTVAWDEVVNAGLDKDKTVVMWWRHNMPQALQAAFEKGFDVVLCPRIPCYFDFVQDDSHKVGRRWKGFGSLDLVYMFPSGLNIREGQVLGMQANLWSETVKTARRFDFMTWPRLQALSEAAWTQEENKDYKNFLGRLRNHLPYLKEKGVYYFNPFDKAEHSEPLE